MNYNLIETDDVIKSILDLNNINKEDLNKEYDFIIKDEVFLNFKEKLLEHKNDRFLIVGDYDCDGICATTIIKKLLNKLEIGNNFIIPSRLKEGYGLNSDIVKMAKDNGFNSLILVDNGIVANEAIDLANSLNLNVFIIDHHEYQELPNALAIIHTNIVSETYKDLSAGGLSFVLSKCFYDDELSLVLGGLSTLSDMMSVIGFNRYLIKEMMKLLKENNIYQMNLLNDRNRFTYDSLSFDVIPKINALSRMEPIGDANKLVIYFLSDEKTCECTIEQINYVNEKRKQCTKDMMHEVKGLLDPSKKIDVISSINFKEGLCGLVSTRISKENNKPSFILTIKDDEYIGSGRSIASFNLYETMKDFKHYNTFGGHSGAVGLSFDKAYYNDFIKYVDCLDYEDESISNDVLNVSIDDLDLDLLDKIENLKPFGTNFNMPLFSIKNQDYKKSIVSNRFPKYFINNKLSAISFNEKHKDIKPNYFIGVLRKDNYNKDSVQFIIEDLI